MITDKYVLLETIYTLILLKQLYCHVFYVNCSRLSKTANGFPRHHKFSLPINFIKPQQQHIFEMGKGIQEIPSGDIQIRTLNLGYNHLENLPAFVFYNNSYKSLHRIELSHNKINNVSEFAFQELKQLKFIDLSYNNLRTIVDKTFTTNNRLERLDLSGNHIEFTENEAFLLSHSLHILILSNNNIEHIFEFNLIGLPNLKHLILDNNKVSIIEPRSFTPLKGLQYLSLSNTDVQNLTETMFSMNKLPRILDLTDTPLGNTFNPPLKKIRDSAVKAIISFNNYLVVS